MIFIMQKFKKARQMVGVYVCINNDGDLLILGGRKIDICIYPFYLFE